MLNATTKADADLLRAAKGCPFCGRAPRLIKEGFMGLYTFRCEAWRDIAGPLEHVAVSHATSAKKALRQWNRREGAA